MQLFCRASEIASDVRCPVCGQGFQLYWTRKSPHDVPVLASVVMEALGRQHLGATGLDPHAGSAVDVLGPTPPAAPLLREAQWGYC